MAKGKCINIGKPCNLAISEEIQDADPANFVCKECGKPLVAVEGGDGPTVPTKPKKKGLIIGICIAAVAAGGLFWYLNQDKDKDNNTEGNGTEVVNTGKTTGANTVTDPDTTDTDTIATTTEPEKEPGKEPGKEPVNPNYLNSYALPYGIYEGPAQDGVPHGPGGEVHVTKAYQLDLKAGGEMLDLNPGDVIIRCKFRNGKIVQGFLKRKNGQAKDFNIGI